MFSFKRKTKQGKIEDQPVTQEEFDTLESNAATLAQVMEIFGEDAQAEGFDLAATVQNLIDSNAAIAEAFGEAADAEDFDAVAAIEALQAESAELEEIETLVSSNKGTTTVEKVKAINPAKKTAVVKKGKETAESIDDSKPNFQNYQTNRQAIKVLESRGIKLAAVDYTTLN